jgi:hypothetical protein
MYMYLLTKETKKLDDDKHLGGVEKSRPKNQTQKGLLISVAP